ncbi:membrane protein insertion efficiency factor YidD [Moraxella caviae]|uniref:Putative membrane protein insertion efficiency factor n=1 Tax=Moraxella caviae TaxID=34060 RepID=A0A1S9ZXB1_9GAMM|nr:membrane protein insertion efficiency factor YidD [Moraxella caviae]OOR88162.1 membrane protein insertion efficiency factor YidD [Moraxella caviae]STZ10517.1 Putative membrane protein insertion efficiency factor [Moraxella caviae]VEW14278.1 Putative membrane protein insertion efficiency factor [Moraxella caviae]
MLKKVLLFLIKVYQRAISPMMSARCRYYPTCSQYAKHALLWHGVWRGGRLAAWRIMRCQPFGGSGVDFVPLALYRERFIPASITHRACLVDYASYKARLAHLLKMS